MGCPWPRQPIGCASGVGAAEQVGAGGRDGHAGPRAPSLPAGLFLTQPVQLVHVVVSGERNLGNVVIWRRTCPLRGNGTVLGESRGQGWGARAQGRWWGRYQGAAQGDGQDVVWGRAGTGGAGHRVLGWRCPAAMCEDSHICFPCFFSCVSFPWPGDGEAQDRTRARAVRRGTLRRSVKPWLGAGSPLPVLLGSAMPRVVTAPGPTGQPEGPGPR